MTIAREATYDSNAHFQGVMLVRPELVYPCTCGSLEEGVTSENVEGESFGIDARSASSMKGGAKFHIYTFVASYHVEGGAAISHGEPENSKCACQVQWNEHCAGAVTHRYRRFSVAFLEHILCMMKIKAGRRYDMWHITKPDNRIRTIQRHDQICILVFVA
eukprot:841930-Amphidinium_carterae.1